MTATGTGNAVIRYNPSNIAASKIVSNLDNRGITVNIIKKDEQNPSADSKTTISSNSSNKETKNIPAPKSTTLGSIKAAKSIYSDMEESKCKSTEHKD